MAFAPFNPPAHSGSDYVYPCDSIVAVGSLVSISPSGTLILANANSIDGRAIGIVTDKPSNTEALVSQFFVLEGLTGVVPKQDYFLSTISGTYSTTPPTSRNSIIQVIGEGLTASSIQVTIDPTQIRLV